MVIRTGGTIGALATLLGCATSEPIQLDSSMTLGGEMAMNGSLALNIEGPIEVKLHGPVIEYEGTYISAELFDAVEIDRTQAEWVLAAFGEPDTKSPLGASDLWVWRYRAASIEGSPVKIMTLGTGEDAAPASVTVILELTDGIVTRKWRG